MIDLQEEIRFHPRAMESGKNALAEGAMIFCDSMMVVKGIIRRHLPAANPVQCMIEEDAVAEMARTNGITRSMAAVDCWKPDLAGSVVVIGNAPTALFRFWNCWKKEPTLLR